MKETICGIIIFLSLFLVIGIVGGVENGQPLSNILWCLPLLASAGVSAYIVQ